MISINRTMKYVSLTTRCKAVHNKRHTVTVVWTQRINQKGDVLGTGYFRVQEYIHHKGLGLRKRIIAMSKAKEKIEFPKSSCEWGTVTYVATPRGIFEMPK